MSTLAPIWEIGLYGGTLVTAASLGITDFVRNRPTQAVATVQIKIDGADVDAAALFGFGSYVQIYCNGQRWFVGRVMRNPATGNGSGQSQTCHLEDPWCELSHRQCRQQWNFQGAVVTNLSGHLILGLDVNGVFITTDAVIREALEYAINAGAPFQIGTLFTGNTIPLDQVNGVTCEEVIRKMLRWQPDVVHWFDYTSTPPTIHFQKRAMLPVVSLAVGNGTAVTAIGEITSRPDLQVPAVFIAYEITSTANGSTAINLEVDAYPAGSTGSEFNAVCPTIALRGNSLTSQTQPVIATPLIASVSNAGILAFLTTFCRDLATFAADPDVGTDGISIVSCNAPVLPDPDATEFKNDGSGNTQPVVLDTTLGNVLVQGSVTQWMAKTFHIVAQKQRIVFTYSVDTGSGDGDDDGSLQTYTASIDVMATNAVTNLYTALTSFSPGQSPPAGLAQAYFEALNPLQWSGDITLEEPIPGLSAPGATMGSALNVVGSQNAAWATMNALISSEEVSAANGRTRLSFGPPKHLSVQDMVDRLLNTRPAGVGGREMTGLTTDASTARTTGVVGADNQVGLGVQSPVQGGNTAPSVVAPFTGLGFVLQKTSSGQIRVTTSNLNGDVPQGFSPGDDPPYLLDAIPGNIVYACSSFDVTGGFVGALTSRTLGSAATLPADDPNNAIFYYRIGSIGSNGQPVNDAYGPLYTSVFRDWNVSPIYYDKQWFSWAAPYTLLYQTYTPTSG